MKIRIRNALVGSLVLLLLAFPGYAQYRQSDSKLSIVGGVDESGEIDGAPYRLVVPAAWNGTLIVYGRFYRDKADHPGEPNTRTPDVVPSLALEPVLLGQGYALAGSAFKDNGWAVEEGYVDSLNLVAHFKANVGVPNRILFWGFSLGSVIGFKNAETTTVYDGILCACAIGGGTPGTFDGTLDLLVAYDNVFGMLANWGSPGDVRDDLDFEGEVWPKLGSELGNAANFPAFEFIRLVVGTPGRGIDPPPPPNFYPNWVATDMFFATEARAELERRANGAVVQNLDRDYNLTVSERAYLNGLGIPNAQLDTWLVSLNNSRIYSAPQASRDYLVQNRKYTGRLRVPVLTMHTIVDPLIPVTQENAYMQTVGSAGRPTIFNKIRNAPGRGSNPREFLSHLDLLYQTYTNGNGHCNFTNDQLVTAITTLDIWVATRTRPTTANFPEALGFDNNFAPPPPNQP